MSKAAGTNAGKDVLYIDVDDEITAIIDKVRASNQKIVALVLPKRASMLQSIVNMKLLKRSADESKKKIVLITSEPGLLPLAGTVGMHVAKTLQTRPEVPEGPPSRNDDTDVIEEAGEIDSAEPDPLDKNRSVGELAGATAVDSELDDTIELDNEPTSSSDSTSGSAGAPAKSAKEKKKLKIPNFNKFRLALVIAGAAVILLIVGSVFAFKILPKASLTIKTDSQAVSSSVPLSFKTDPGTELNAEKGVIPATIQQVQKTQEQQVPATGQQNNGQKAAGTVRLALGDCTKDAVTVPAGTGVTSGGKTFITQEAAIMQSVKVGGVCKNGSFPDVSTDTVSVAALSAGSSYNVGPGSFTVAGYSNVSGSSSAAMTGGTDDIIKIVTQADIDAAKQKIGGQDTEQLHNDLKNGLITKGLYAVDQTFKANEADTKLSANPGDKADTVTVTQAVTYVMMGVDRDDLQKVIANAAADKINTKKQKILDYGIEGAQFEVQNQDASSATVTITTTVVAGPELDKEAIKKQVAGKKASTATATLKSSPGVTDVTVDYSPFWVSSIPNDTKKITVTIEKPTVQKTNDSNNP
ncbi:MAG TPA: hypothetical protein VLE73_05490 [Candidatus Saccharimonadales bacterium]|nr:hypothetical protein [Candidatus Saccharimonadales bacterium]